MSSQREKSNAPGISLLAKPHIRRSCRSSALHYPPLWQKAIIMIPRILFRVNIQFLPLRVSSQHR